ncbi:lipoprotein insertase outer membrane protein LolB [Variovorax sp. HJSM1_2]|uniref:lipoprotein insertase outer membrane protein LolB n=1 Tax=Variovorax sp. HJSM1_2 TaxID=3366263 RepID=UPI003BD28569
MALALAATLAGCATSQPQQPRPAAFWSGRMSLQVEDATAQSFTAAFELKGDAGAGELKLFTPFGGTLAVLDWQNGLARLTANGETRTFESMDALILQATGSVIPVTALFDWLNGQDTAVPGWKADLSRLSDGRLSARRSTPTPQADLRIVLDP